jgi:Porin subfamily
MNIKSLLIGSAAALVAVSGARAADAVVAEPEAVEYVRVCDAYGAGYFYIPGTETCLKIGGFVRYEISGGTGSTGFAKKTRGRIEFSTKNESDLGTVTGWIRTQAEHNNGVANNGGHQYSLGVGGLEMGYRDSQWNRFSGYGGVTDNGTNYGYQERHYISYTFSGESFSAIVSLDHDNSANYMPDVMAGVSGKLGSTSVSLSAGYDESAKDAALKATADVALGAANLRIVGLYATGTNSYWYPVNTVAGTGKSGYGIIVGVSAPVGEKLSVGVDFNYDKAAGAKGSWGVVADVNYKIASGLDALLEVGYNDKNTNLATTGKASTSYMLRFQRSF